MNNCLLKLIGSGVCFVASIATTSLADAATQSEDAPTGLVVYLPFNKDFQDYSGNNNHGSPRGNVQIVDDPTGVRPGKVAEFDGSGDWVILPHIPLNNRPFAFAFWLKADAGSAYGLVMQKASDATNRFFHLMTRFTRRPYLGFYGNDVSSPLAIDMEWNHLVFQYTGTAQEIWHNGQRVAVKVTSAYAGTSGSTYIGRDPNWSNVSASDLKGYVDEFRVYDRALTEEEIQMIMGFPFPPSIVHAVSRRYHEQAGLFDVPLNLYGDASIECRAGSLLRLIFTFTKEVVPADGVLDNEVVVSNRQAVLSLEGRELTAEIWGASSPSCLTVAISGLVDLEGQPLEGPNQLCLGILTADVNGDGKVNIFDLVSTRNAMNQPVTATNFRADVNASGAINIFDLVAIRNNLNMTLDCDSPPQH